MGMIFRRKMLFAGIGFIILIAVLIVVVREYRQKNTMPTIWLTTLWPPATVVRQDLETG